MNSQKRSTGHREKIQKNVELQSVTRSYIESEMEEGERIKMTPLAKSLGLSNGSNPHVYTVRSMLTGWDVAKPVINKINFLYNREGILEEIEKIRTEDLDMQKFKLEIKIKLEELERKIDALLSK